ncbi:Sporulation-specific protein 75 [Nakaseomyces bracarensis]|uniref:Sporulation-specific protein 75 n=1 Tax=Nakaseomyces bracarensis TaxID=273131 RepID=A0ABR4P126_9SACH
MIISHINTSVIESQNQYIYFESRSWNITSNLVLTFLKTARAGSAHKDADITVNSFVLGIGVSAAYFLFQLFVFSLLRRILGNIYQARNILKIRHTESKCNEFSNRRIISRFKAYIPELFTEDSDCYENTVGLDGILFLRFLRLLVYFFSTVGLINVPILIPAHYYSGEFEAIVPRPENGVFKKKMITRIDMINMSNISAEKSDILIVHFVLSIFLVVWFHIILITEFNSIHVRINRANITGKYQRTVFFDNVPTKSIQSNRNIFNHFNSIHEHCIMKIERIPTNINKLQKLHKNLEYDAKKIETAILKIILEKFFKVGYKLFDNKSPKHEINPTTLMVLSYHQMVQYLLFKLRSPERFLPWTFNVERRLFNVHHWRVVIFVLTVRKQSILKKHYTNLALSVKKYHTNLKLWINNVQKTNYHARTAKIIDSKQYMKKVFITFNSPIYAHWIAEQIKNSAAKEWNNPIIGPNPRDLIWFNLKQRSASLMLIRRLVACILSILIILGWVLPVAFVGLVTQIPYLTNLIPYSDHIYVNSRLVREITKAIFPLVTLIFLTEFVPYIFRLVSYLKGCRTGSEIEEDIQRWFFIFLLVHIFLVVTITSGITLLFEKVMVNPVSIPAILAHDLPQSSNFFCSFVLLRGFAYAGGNFIRIKELIYEVLFYRPRIQSPHEKMERLMDNISFQWGSIYPLFTVLGCIVIIYSIISPLILPLCIISFLLVYYSFKYLFKYHCTAENISETNGKLYPQALSQLYAGIYCMEFCLIGLFALFNKYKLSSAMIFISIITIMAHVEISNKYMKKIQYINLGTKKPIRDNGTPISANEETTCFILPPITDKIWVPTDPLNIVETEKCYLQSSLCLKCDFDRAYVTKFGNICMNPTY